MHIAILSKLLLNLFALAVYFLHSLTFQLTSEFNEPEEITNYDSLEDLLHSEPRKTGFTTTGPKFEIVKVF